MPNPTKSEKKHWDRLINEIGCVACLLDGNPNHYAVVHHINGRTKPGAHMNVIGLCAGHHQDGAGNDKTMIAVHPYKARFEAKYMEQRLLKFLCNDILNQNEIYK